MIKNDSNLIELGSSGDDEDEEWADLIHNNNYNNSRNYNSNYYDENICDENNNSASDHNYNNSKNQTINYGLGRNNNFADNVDFGLEDYNEKNANYKTYYNESSYDNTINSNYNGSNQDLVGLMPASFNFNAIMNQHTNYMNSLFPTPLPFQANQFQFMNNFNNSSMSGMMMNPNQQNMLHQQSISGPTPAANSLDFPNRKRPLYSTDANDNSFHNEI